MNVVGVREDNWIPAFLESPQARYNGVIFAPALVDCIAHDTREGDKIPSDRGIADRLRLSLLDNLCNKCAIDLVEIQSV